MAVAGHIVANLTANTTGWTSGLRGALGPLSSFTSKVIAAGAVAAAAFSFTSLIRGASDVEETMNKFNIVFGRNSEAVKEWGDNYAAQVGRSKNQIADFLASSQDLFVPIGFDAKSAEAISKTISQLSVDLASFNNLTDAQTFGDLQAALTGSGEVMKKYGVIVSEAAVKQELLNAGLNPAAATETQKVWARLQIIMRGTTAAQGDAVRSADGWANQMKKLSAVTDDLRASLGERLLPMMTSGLSQLNSVILKIGPPLSSLVEWVSQMVAANAEWLPVLAKTAVFIGTVVIAMKAITLATQAYAKSAAFAQAIAMGPKGWAMLAAGLVAGTAAAYALDSAFESLNETTDKAITSQSQVAEAIKMPPAAMTESAKAVDVHKTAMDSLKKQYDAFTPKAAQVGQTVRKMGEDWLAAARAGEPLQLTFRQLQELQHATILKESGVTSMFGELRKELAVLRGEITETEQTFAEMATFGVDTRYLDQLRAMVAERDKLLSDQEAKEKAAKENESRLSSVADRVASSNETPLSRFAAEVAEVKAAIAEGFVNSSDGLAHLEKLRQQMLAEETSSQQKTEQRKQASNVGVDSRSAAANQQIVDLVNRRGTNSAESRAIDEQRKQTLLSAKTTVLLTTIRDELRRDKITTKPFGRAG